MKTEMMIAELENCNLSDHRNLLIIVTVINKVTYEVLQSSWNYPITVRQKNFCRHSRDDLIGRGMDATY